MPLSLEMPYSATLLSWGFFFLLFFYSNCMSSSYKAKQLTTMGKRGVESWQAEGPRAEQQRERGPEKEDGEM